MFMHSKDGNHFLGYRKSSFGKVQMVYDCAGTCREIYDLETPDVPAALLNSAIKKAIKHWEIVLKNVPVKFKNRVPSYRDELQQLQKSL